MSANALASAPRVFDADFELGHELVGELSITGRQLPVADRPSDAADRRIEGTLQVPSAIPGGIDGAATRLGRRFRVAPARTRLAQNERRGIVELAGEQRSAAGRESTTKLRSRRAMGSATYQGACHGSVQGCGGERRGGGDSSSSSRWVRIFRMVAVSVRAAMTRSCPFGQAGHFSASTS